MIRKLVFVFLLVVSSFGLFGQDSEAAKMVGELFQIQFDSPQEAIELGNKILNTPKVTDFEQSYALIGIGTSYSIQGKTSKAVPYLLKAIDVAEKTTNYELRVNSNLALANVYTKMNLHEQSYAYILKAQKEVVNEPMERNRLFTGMRIATQLGQNLTVQNKFDESLKSLNEALVLAKQYEKIKTKESIPAEFFLIYAAIGETYYSRQDWKNAEKYFNHVVKLNKKGKNDFLFDRAFSYSYLGKIYLHQNQYERAVDTLLIAAKNNDNKRSYIQADLYHTLSQAYEKIGEENEASKYKQLYLNEKSKISDEEKSALSASLKNEMRIVKEQEATKRTTQLWFVSILGFLFVLGSFIVYRILQRKKEAKLKYQETIKRLENSIKEKSEREKSFEIEEPKVKRTTSSATELTENKLLQKLEKFERSEAYLSSKVSLSSMASQFDTNQSYISELINSSRNKSFNQYINDLRIDYICRKIYEDPIYRNYKISHLADICGYPSHTSFTKIFKKVTGISPSVFIANANNDI